MTFSTKQNLTASNLDRRNVRSIFVELVGRCLQASQPPANTRTSIERVLTDAELLLSALARKLAPSRPEEGREARYQS